MRSEDIIVMDSNIYDNSFPYFIPNLQIYNWTPQVFNETHEDQINDPDAKAIFKKMPTHLKKAIAIIKNPSEVSTFQLLYFVICDLGRIDFQQNMF